MYKNLLSGDFVNQQTETQKLTITSIHTINKLINGKKDCLIINSGYLTSELIKEDVFIKFYNLKIWDKNSEIDSLNSLLVNQSVIILDNSGNEELSSKELELINMLKLEGYNVFGIDSFYEHLTGRIPLVSIHKGWAINNGLFIVSKREKFFFLKRTIDIFVTVLILPISLFFATLGMLLIRVTSKGPVLFKQNRVGKNGKVFTLYKIRTMVFSEEGHKKFTTKNDDRILPVGKILRITKIDELPQLINILKGEMSLIGPRPEKDEIVKKLVAENPYYNLRHIIKPGITGWAQVNHPTATPDENLQKLEYDLYYIKSVSIFLDLKILYRTAKVVLTLNSH